MAVLDSNQTVSNNVSGFDKMIHASARTMMLDNLQGTMYSRPIDSAVRECVSNAVDAIKEKNTAKEIKSGRAKVSDYYLTREDVRDKIANSEDDIYADSEFDPSYYDLKWLDDNDTILLQYINNDSTQRDQFIIKDPGVGLGGKRLEGFFSLGFSSKRLNSGELGGFGLGAKSPLATGCDSYRMITCYNGKRFSFDIYSHKVDCVYGNWNNEGGKNDYVEFPNILVSEKYTDEEGNSQTRQVPYKAFYEKTTEKNSTSIIIEVKKHNRSKFFEAVKSQLMYLKADIVLQDVSHGRATDIPFKAKPIYEDDDIILSDYGYYNKPHFVIKGIAYGLIDFNEAELAQKHGNVGYKFAMEDLKVLPTREGVQYDQKTNSAIVNVSKKVTKTVESKIQAELQQNDFVDWLIACNKISFTTASTNSQDVVARLAALADIQQVQPVFPPDNTVKFSGDAKTMFTPLISLRHVYIHEEYSWKTSKKTKKVKRDDTNNIQFISKPLYFQFTRTSGRTDAYLANTHNERGGFIAIKMATSYSYLEGDFEDYINDKVDFDTFVAGAHSNIEAVEPDSKKCATVKATFDKCAKAIQLMKNSTSTNKPIVYSEKLVPEGYVVTANEEDPDVIEDNSEEEDAKRKADLAKAIAKRRRENKQFIAYKLTNKRNSTYSYGAGFERVETSVSELDFDNCRVIYGGDEDESALRFLTKLRAHIGNSYNNKQETYYWDDDLKILKVAKTNLRYVKNDGTPVKDFMFNVDAGTLRGTEEIRRSLTTKSISKILLDKCQFLRNFSYINQEVYDEYRALVDYTEKAPNPNIFDGSTDYLNLFEEYYKINLTLLNTKVTEEEHFELLDGVTTNKYDLDILDVDLIDRNIYERALRLEAFADVYGTLFNNIDALTHRHSKISNDLRVELLAIVDAKKDQLEYEYSGINK